MACTTLGLLVPSAVLGSAVPYRNIVLNVARPTFADLLPLRALDVWLDERVGPPSRLSESCASTPSTSRRFGCRAIFA